MAWENKSHVTHVFFYKTSSPCMRYRFMTWIRSLKHNVDELHWDTMELPCPFWTIILSKQNVALRQRVIPEAEITMLCPVSTSEEHRDGFGTSVIVGKPVWTSSTNVHTGFVKYEQVPWSHSTRILRTTCINYLCITPLSPQHLHFKQ